jgi:hypothetical protein
VTAGHIRVDPICPQIQKPVVKTDMHQLAQELEGLAEAQVRREWRPHWAGSSQRRLGIGRERCLNWGGGKDRG